MTRTENRKTATIVQAMTASEPAGQESQQSTKSVNVENSALRRRSRDKQLKGLVNRSLTARKAKADKLLSDVPREWTWGVIILGGQE